ncbi:MAG TPA: OsmC family protein [Candidatus Limnocylindrales bacterium]|nr:OsmC family protein [Candidatus Limnocylindrales bacterium]
MPERTARARWQGDLRGGKGLMEVGSGAFKGAYSFATRFENAPGTNPEELIGAAEAGCFSMAFANELSKAGHTPKEISTTAVVHLGQDATGFAILEVDLSTEGVVPGIDEATFQKIAEQAKQGCPVSKALKATPITLRATLKSGVAAG